MKWLFVMQLYIFYEVVLNLSYCMKVLSLSLCSFCFGFNESESAQYNFRTWVTIQAIWSANGGFPCCKVNMRRLRLLSPVIIFFFLLVAASHFQCPCTSFKVSATDDWSKFTNNWFLSNWYVDVVNIRSELYHQILSWAKIFSNLSCPVYHTDFEVDMNGKRFSWQVLNRA